MTKFKIIIWYVGVLLVFFSLVLSFVTKNWLLAGACALVTAILKSKNNEVSLPKFYQEKGISNSHFVGGGKHEKNNK